MLKVHSLFFLGGLDTPCSLESFQKIMYSFVILSFAGQEKKLYLKRALMDVTSDERKKFFMLHDSKVGEKEEKTVDGIWRTNNFALGQSGSRSNNGLFLKISRFNHSCVPVAEFVWNEEKKQQEIRAIRRIVKGSEITICYFTRLVAAQ